MSLLSADRKKQCTNANTLLSTLEIKRQTSDILYEWAINHCKKPLSVEECKLDQISQVMMLESDCDD